MVHGSLVAIKVIRIFALSTYKHQSYGPLSVSRCLTQYPELLTGFNTAAYREALLWKMTDHPNVLRFIGLGDRKTSLGMLYWSRRGCLREIC